MSELLNCGNVTGEGTDRGRREAGADPARGAPGRSWRPVSAELVTVIVTE
ncbi:hypothetical protein GCM10027168_02100 [Streptomyces capparidis]